MEMQNLEGPTCISKLNLCSKTDIRKTAWINLYPGNTIVEQEVDIMNNKIPLLISRPTMTKLGFINDTKRGEIKVDGTNDVLEVRSYSIRSL